jgi:hypothetical protein
MVDNLLLTPLQNAGTGDDGFQDVSDNVGSSVPTSALELITQC